MADPTPINETDSVRLGGGDSRRAITCDSMGALLAISYALGGRLELEQVLTGASNLVSNAVEACGEGGQVKVRVYYNRRRSRFTISVTDNGPGITPENRSKMFTEFFTTKGGQGTGLGLPVTKKLVTELGGKIKFHSVPNHGARFVITLPTGSEINS